MGSVGHTLVCKYYEPPIKGKQHVTDFRFRQAKQDTGCRFRFVGGDSALLLTWP